MTWLGFKRATVDQAVERERAAARIREQEQRVQAVGQMVEVVQRRLDDDGSHVPAE